MSALIRVKGLTKIYRPQALKAGEEVPEVHALDGIDLEIRRGDFVSIVGQSGSGKSTLMQILGLLDRKTEGEYFLDGEDVSLLDDEDLAKLRSQKIGFIFQFFNLLARTSATDNVALPMLYAGDTSPNAKAQELLRKVGLADRLFHRPHQLSGGQQQRVAIARALANDPAIIFADEPTGNISSEQSEEILSMLEALNEQGVTIVLVTHEPDVAMRARRMLTMKDGRVAKDERFREIAPLAKSSSNKTYEKTTLRKRIRENFHMAWVALSLNKLRTGLATLGIVIGIASVVAMVSVGKGAQATIEEQLSSLGTNVLSVWPQSPRSTPNMAGRRVPPFDIEDYDALRRSISEESPILDVGAQVNGTVLAASGANTVSTRLLGVTASYEKMQNAGLTAGFFFTEKDDVNRLRVVLLGQTVVKNLFPNKNPLGSVVKINKVEFRVVGVLKAKGSTGFQDADDQVIVPLRTAMFRVLGSSFFGNLSIAARGAERVDLATQQTEQILRIRRGIKPGMEDNFSVRSLNEIRDAVNKSTQAISTLLAAIASISLIVGGIGIMNVMLVSVKERTKEIGLRKALGAQKRDILFQFLVEAVVICLLGGAIGLSLGYGIAFTAAITLGWKSLVPPSAAALAFFFSSLVGIVFGLWPAKQASNLSPIEALRYE